MAEKNFCLKEVLLSIQTFMHSLQNTKAVSNFDFSYMLSDDVETTSSESVKTSFNLLLDCLSSLKPKVQADCSIEIKMESPESEDDDQDDECVPNRKNLDLVQIQVDREEIDRRISSFVDRKRKEVNEWNTKEFCNNHIIDEENPLMEEINSCARVDAIYVCQAGHKSRIKISKVENTWGPQIQRADSENNQINIKKEPQEYPRVTGLSNIDDIEERLKNMESHLRMKNENSFKRSIYSRLKVLEDRILFLEGLSPDYFCPRSDMNGDPYESASKEKEKALMSCSMGELQLRMRQLKDSLHRRMKQTVSASLTE